MVDRVILVFGMEQLLSVAPSHGFWLYLIDQQRVVDQVFSDPFAASKWAQDNGATIVNEWTHDELVESEDVVAANVESGAFVVCITLYRNGQVASNEKQPPRRYWIFLPDGRRIATRSTLAEALAYIGIPLLASSPSDSWSRSQSLWDHDRQR